MKYIAKKIMLLLDLYLPTSSTIVRYIEFGTSSSLFEEQI